MRTKSEMFALCILLTSTLAACGDIPEHESTKDVDFSRLALTESLSNSDGPVKLTVVFDYVNSNILVRIEDPRGVFDLFYYDYVVDGAYVGGSSKFMPYGGLIEDGITASGGLTGRWQVTARSRSGRRMSVTGDYKACLTSGNSVANVYMAHSDVSMDTFYTTSISEYNIALANGAVGYGRVFGLETASSFNGDATMGNKRFDRYYKYLPQTDHFLTYQQSEKDYVAKVGYTYEGSQGFIYDKNKPNTVPLYRLSICHPGLDVDHRYTTSETEMHRLELDGFSLDGVAGYVCP